MKFLFVTIVCKYFKHCHIFVRFISYY